MPVGARNLALSREDGSFVCSWIVMVLILLVVGKNVISRPKGASQLLRLLLLQVLQLSSRWTRRMNTSLTPRFLKVPPAP
jgi:hypothetical protein